VSEVLSNRVMEQKIDQCLKSVLLSEPRIEPLANPLDASNPGLLVEKTFAVYPAVAPPPNTNVIMMGDFAVPAGMLPAVMREAFGQKAENTSPDVWKQMVQILVNKRTLNDYYGTNSFPEGTMEFGKFVQSLVLVTVQNRLEKVFFPAKEADIEEDGFDITSV